MGVTSIIDPRFLDGSATNQIPVLNSTTGLFTPSSTLSGLTLNSPIISGNFSWAGISTWTISDAVKTIVIGDSLTFQDASNIWLALDPLSGQIVLGNGVNNPEFAFEGSGLTTLGGNILVNGGYIGITGDTQLIQLTAGTVTFDGDLVISGMIDAVSDSAHTISRTVGSGGVPSRVLILDRTASPSVLAGDGTELRFRVVDDSFSEVVGNLSFSTISNLDDTPESIFKVTTFNAGVGTVGMTLDNLSNLNVIGNIRIGDTVTPTHGLEVNASSQFLGSVGFYGITPVTQNQLATGVGATADDVITELQRLGLVRQAA